jgi:dTDP-4-amino-4,6-dideoxygalactose transaminase
MTTGEGGMVVCADEATARRVRLLRNQGMEKRYANEVVGYNARMSDLHAAIGRVQLRHLPEWTSIRRRNAAVLTEALCDVAARSGLVLPSVATAADPVWHQYTVRAPDRDQVAERLAERGVPTGIYYPTPIHRLPAYDLELELPQTTAAAREVLSLPVHPNLSAGQLDDIVDAVDRAMLR